MTADGTDPQASPANEDWLTVYEVAGLFLARAETVKAWIRDGALEAVDRGRLGLRIRRDVAERFVAEHLASEGFRSADHSFSSGVRENVLTSTAVPEQAVDRQGAGWPFRRDANQRDVTQSP